MKTTRMDLLKRAVAIALGLAFVVGNILMLLGASIRIPNWVGLLLLLGLFASEFGLLVLNARGVGQWRVAGFFWAIYVLARIAASQLDEQGTGAGVTFSMAIAVYAMFAGWFSLVALAIRRDVSVVYFVAPFAILPIVLRAQVMASGSMLALLGPSQQLAEFQTFSLMEPIMMVAPCMITLGLVTFVPHFLWLWIKEARRDQIRNLT